ncbi:pyridoxal phosphate-dependent aminotransferase [Jannaschia sp. 2305UL9-9]|uniref:pyridoxal phosphate-dependent aminotransferase n=1 Tax=Jannaschia sp. 2305UL9-9 TaxID=3121638 RepID=UPI00352893B5
MTQTSNRVRTLAPGGDDGWAIFHRARAMRAAGVSLADLTVGDHDIGTDPAILTAMDAAARGGHTGYAAIAGTDGLRDAIAARVSTRTGVATTRDNVLVTTGGQAALFAAAMACIDPGGRILFPDPYYATYPGTVRAAGGTPVPVPTRPEDGFQPRRAALEAAGPADALLINTPSNPTGAVYDADTMDQIAQFATANDAWLISDEVYDTQVWSGTHVSPRALPGMAERCFVVGSMSKSHAMTGSRIGWLIGPEAAIADLIVLVTHTTYGVPGFIQDAAEFALSRGDAFEAAIAAPFLARRDACLAVLAEQSVVGVIPSGGAMYLMLDIRATGMSAFDFAAHLLEAHHIAVMPGDSFGKAAAGHLRVALTQPEERLIPALTTILSVAKEMAA